MRKAFLCLFFWVFLAGTAGAEPFDDGLAAYQRQDFPAALRYWQEAAGQGDTRAMLNLGVMHDRGQGVPEDDAEAVKWYRAAAGAGIADAQYYLAQKYRSGQGIGQDVTEAVKWYRRAGEQGHVQAERVLGVLFLNGDGVSPDHGEALRWLQKAADHGDVQSFHNLGYMYQNGLGVPADATEAMRWYRKAAEHGLARSQYNLGIMYLADQGVPVDYAEAEKWLRKAAEQGNADAQTGLGALYANGQGVERDNLLAYMWFLLAAEQGHAPANEYRETIAGRLDADQLVQARNRAAEWLQEHTAVSQTAAGLAPAAPDQQPSPAEAQDTSTAKAIFYPQEGETDSGNSTRGAVTWRRLEKDGEPPVILARIDLPQPSFSLEMTISKNTDAYLPATHLVEITISGATALSDVPVDRIPALLLKADEKSTGTALVGAGVQVTDTIYWLALSEVPETAWRNIALLRSSTWFEMPIEFKDKSRSLIVFEKGPAGRRIVESVIADWGTPASAKAE